MLTSLAFVCLWMEFWESTCFLEAVLVVWQGWDLVASGRDSGWGIARASHMYRCTGWDFRAWYLCLKLPVLATA